ncbi:MAG: PHP domain-containing protein [Bacteroidia bacterium]|nr:PHP domain-containing protein [Bacteroidia bacterium]MDW8088847.1 PHP domain-containing protein [Bacteroidia bacterium]
MGRELVLERLDELIERLELVADAPFRVRAYQRLREILTALPEESWTSDAALARALQNRPGIGEGLRRLALELYLEGTSGVLEALRQEVPESLLELRRLPGLGPKRIKQLWKEARITSVDGLAQALRRGTLAKLKGWTPALISRLEAAVAWYQSQRDLLLYYEACKVWEKATETLTQQKIRIAAVGELRRALPLVRRVEGIVELSQAEVLSRLGWQAHEGAWHHPTLPVTLYAVSPERWGEALLFYTGPEAFWNALAPHLATLSTLTSEEAIFAQLGLPRILPAWRDWADILELAAEGRLPEPIEPSDIRGSLHVHTTFSDGSATPEALAEKARQYGWKWLGIADHSQRAYYAKGLPPERLNEQIAYLAHLNASFQGTFYLLCGVEADILPDGTLDYGPDVWPKLDYIVASVHEKLTMTREEATARLARALDNPYVRVLGHWTGRLLRNRPGYPLDEAYILDLCAQKGIAIEFNANPYRMEIDWVWVRRAAEKGVRIVLTTDAHSVDELDYWRQGLAVLQKGLLPKSLLLNTSEAPPFLHME